MSSLVPRGARRSLLGVAAASALLAAVPAAASAAGQSLKLSPCASCKPSSSSFTAGGDSSFTATAALDQTKGAPKAFSLQLASGLLADLSSATAEKCLTNPSGTDTASCKVGKGAIGTSAGSVPYKAYLVAPSSGHAAGIDIVAMVGTLPAELSLKQISVGGKPGPVVGILSGELPNVSPLSIDGLTLHVNGTLPDGSQLTRMPSACTVPSDAGSTLAVTYAKGSEKSKASPDVKVASSCGSLPYAPKLKATVARDSKGGATVTTKVTQTAAQAASGSIALDFPSSISPNVSADISCLSGSPCKVGSASGVSPLLPSAALANGTATLGGSVSSPTLTITFPAVGVSLLGSVDLSNNSVTFGSVPDVPLTKLTVKVTGTKAGKAFNTTCKSGSVVGKFTGQNGKKATSTAPYKVTGACS